MSAKGIAAAAALTEVLRQSGIPAETSAPLVAAFQDVVETCERIDNNGPTVVTKLNQIKAQTDKIV